MNASLDHVMWAWEDLNTIIDIFSRVGLEPDYGGTHQDLPTEMAMLGFKDETYLELLAPVDPTNTPEQWPESMFSAGPCRWCLRPDDFNTTLDMLSEAGTTVWGPGESSRTRPDGIPVEYEEVVYGSEGTLWRLPFLINDLTPRANRLYKSESVSESGFTGIAEVVIAVTDLDDATEQLCRLHEYPSPKRTVHKDYGATLASFPAQPVTLAEPLDETSWLSDRLRQHREGPCTVLIGSEDFSTAETTYRVTESMEWFTSQLRWFDDPELRRRLGIVGGCT